MAAFTLASVIAAYVAALQGVTGMGLVYDYRREVRDEPTARALWWHDGQQRIHAWSVSLDDTSPLVASRGPGFGARGSGQSGRVLTGVNLQIDAVFGIDDANASEKTFRDLLWTVVDACNSVGLITDGAIDQAPMVIDRFGYLVLAGMYHVHFARLKTGTTGQTRP